MMHAAIRLIRDEHRSISAVLRAAQFLVDKALSTGTAPDFELLHAMLYYLREFPEQRHHPKEDRVLFAQIRSRTREADAAIAELREEHKRGDEMLRVLEMALDHWQAGATDGARQFAEVLSGYTRFHHAHMEKEETRVLPAAERALSNEDWHEIYSAFESHRDPMFGKDTANEFRDLFAKIIRLSPPPTETGKPQG